MKIILADDHPLLLKGLKEYLEEEGLKVSGEATNGSEAFQLIQKIRPDLAILDIEMPELNGLQVAELVNAHHLPTKIILITVHKEASIFNKARNLGVCGYILKEYALQEIKQCIEKVQQGGIYMGLKTSPTDDKSGHEALTPSEKKVLRLISQQLSTAEIAEKLFISKRTVEKHRSNIIAKLNLSKASNAIFMWTLNNPEEFL